jgi:hypothetical protein
MADPLSLSPTTQGVLIGIVIGAIPQNQLAAILVAFVGKKLGVKPGQIRSYQSAVDDGGEEEETNDTPK